MAALAAIPSSCRQSSACSEGGRKVRALQGASGTFVRSTGEYPRESTIIATRFPERVATHGNGVGEIAVKPFRAAAGFSRCLTRGPHLKASERSRAGQRRGDRADGGITGDGFPRPA